MEILGSDFQTQPVNTQLQDAKLLDIPDLANMSANSIRQSIGEVQKINSAAANTDAEAFGRRVVVQPQRQTGIIEGLTGVAELGLKFVADQEKAKAAAAEKEFIIEANKLAANAPELINNTDEGGIGYQARVEALARRYSGVVDAGQLQTQLVRLYSPVQQSQEVGVTALRKEADRVRETNTEVFVKQQVLTLDTQLAELELVSNPEERNTRINNVLKVFTDSLVGSKLRPEERLYATNAFLTTLGKSSAKGSEVGARVQDTLRIISETNQFIQETESLPDSEKAALRTGRLATLPPNLQDAYRPVLDQAAVHKRAVEEYKMQQEFDRAVKQNRIDAKKAFQLQSGQAAALTARYILSSGQERPQLEAQFSGSPALEAIATAGKQYLSDFQTRQNLAKEESQLAITVAGLGKSDAKERLSWIQQAFQMPNLSLNISVVSELQQAVQNLQKSLSGGTPAEVQRAQQEVEKYNKVLLDATNARIKQVREQMNQVTAPWQEVESLIRDPKKREVIERNYSEVLKNLQRQTEVDTQSTINGTNPLFNMPQLATVQVGDVKVPLPFKPNAQVSFSGSYGEDRGSHQHAGVDFAVPVGTPLIAPVGGIVESARSVGAYGNIIDLRLPDGKIMRMAHLNSFNVKEGQRVIPGQVLGMSGNTGRSTGPHLHLEIRNDLYGGYEKTEDPIAYLNRAFNNSNRGVGARRGAGVPPNTPPNAYPLQGAYLSDGKIVRRDGSVGVPSYSNRNPIREIPLPADKTKYVSSPENNYGYKALAEDTAFRRELYRVSKNLKVPTQWLADLMAFETGGTFSASIQNQGWSKARGLIQFMPETAQDLGTSVEALARMSRAEQMRYVEKYLRIHTDNGKLVTKPEDLVMAVWGGLGNLRKLKNNPESVRNLSDDNITFSQYVKRLGEHAGRRYQTSFEPRVAPVHTSYRSSCLKCQALTKGGMGFIPHEAP